MTEQLSLFFDAPPPPPVPSLPDHAARVRIRTDLDANLLVEAGAGAGKTTEMVKRMVALVRSGRAEAAQIAAVTFTRKAAAELRERFQTELERELRDAAGRGEHDVVARIDGALREIDRAFLGTIHAFCARLLRERPLDAGIDPAFRETLGSEEKRLRKRFWASWLERLSAAGDPVLAELRDVGLQPQQLGSLYEELVEQPDVVYPLERVARPEATFMRRRLEQLMDEASAYLPAHEPARGWDALQKTLHRLRFHRDVLGWSRDTTFLDVISDLKLGSFDVVQNRWGDGKAAKALSGELRALFNDDGAADRLRREWWAYRYPIALQFAQRAARAYAQERVRAGTLNFQDLLMLAAQLLRRSPAARRELGERYRYLLVDEFQDTDPIQAEVLFLLASDEELDLFTDTPNIEHVGEWLPPFASWRHLTPRPGALFVVGDPKQSIYRFRRADMTLYQQVKRRFEAFGAVVELIANFRSRKPIEVFVNDIFRDRFPPEDTEEQAQYAAMVVQPPRTPAAAEGVFWYELDDPVNGLVEKLAAQDAERLAAWVKQRIDAGERCAGDFLILTPNTTRLELYASQLESHDVPVQVTGAGVGEREELQELRLLLRALSDPGDATLTVAVLVGLFFGIDYEQLTAHAVDRSGRFRFTDEFTAPATEVEKALATMQQFWRWTRAEPADVAVARIVAELGLVPLAAASPLGASRAGALLFALDAIRVAALAGDASIAGAISALDAALDEDESEAPLEPGRDDVVRVMNLHKAKGLEARVGVLASPFGGGFHQPTRRVVRDETGRALGFTTVSDGDRKLAQPRDWTSEHAPIEERFEAAEQDRLLYVAATRAADELVIGCAYNNKSPSKWRLFHNWLKANATVLLLPSEQQARRDRLELAPAEIMTAIEDADARRRAAKARTYRLAAVTSRKGDVRFADTEAEAIAHATETDIVGRGTDWGIAVHDALLAAARGEHGDRLRAFCRTRLLGLGRGIDANGEPVELTELLQIVDSVLASTMWKRAKAGSPMLVEAPFALRLTAEEYAAAIGQAEPESDAAEVIDGRIDLVFREPDGWVIIDYKSDAGGERIPAELLRLYRGQLALYAAAWERLTGEPVKERALLFTATGAVV